MSENIPPLIEGWVSNLLKESTPSHIKQNYATTLKIVRDHIDEALRQYDNSTLVNTFNRKKA